MSEEDEVATAKKHPKYKAYHSEVQTCLQSFEKCREWPDLINWVQRLEKVLTNDKYAQIAIVPESLTLSKRLAQCLNPSLPSGVHIKTLKAYDIIFGRLSPNLLARTLPMYSVGLFGLYQHAASAVKPDILSLYANMSARLRYSSVSWTCLSHLPAGSNGGCCHSVCCSSLQSTDSSRHYCLGWMKKAATHGKVH
jgi:hypothetical protein